MKALCPECGSHKIQRHISEQFCGGCGFVLDEGTFKGS